MLFMRPTSFQMSKLIHPYRYMLYIFLCNMTKKFQMNSKTGFIRSIRRVQQASYPVGKPPASFYSSHTSSTQGSMSFDY